MTHIHKGFEELLSDLKSYEQGSRSIANAKAVLEHSLKHNAVGDAIKIARAEQTITRLAKSKDVIKPPKERTSVFEFASTGSYDEEKRAGLWNHEILSDHFGPIFDEHRLPLRDWDNAGRRSLEAEEKLEPLMRQYVLENLIADYNINQQEQRVIRKTVELGFGELRENEKRVLVGNDNALFALHQINDRLGKLFSAINDEGTSRLLHMAKIVFPPLRSNAGTALETLKKA